MVVTKLCEGVPRPLPLTSAEALARLHHSAQPGCQGGGPLRVMVASGPFCCADNLEYAPLRDLLHQATKLDPVDVLVLLGPFVDVAHPQVAQGAVQMEADDGGMETVDLWTLFYFKVSGMLEAIYEAQPELSLQVVLAPSQGDAHHDAVYPQPPLADRVPGGVASPFFDEEKLFRLDIPHSTGPASKRLVHCVGNPSLIAINEVVIGITSTDVLMHLGKEEISQNPATSNRLDRLADHLLQQQSFYPLYPATGSDAPPLDLRFSDKWRMPVSPDVMLVPSRLATFARRLNNGTLALNPGQLSKGTGGGTYAKLTIFPIPANANSQDDPKGALHQVAERTSVQIKRI
jgi:DNA polymerase alpha subunit B